MIRVEVDRAYNSTLLAEFKKLGGPDIYLDVNQPREEFVQQFKRSRPNEVKILEQALQKLI